MSVVKLIKKLNPKCVLYINGQKILRSNYNKLHHMVKHHPDYPDIDWSIVEETQSIDLNNVKFKFLVGQNTLKIVNNTSKFTPAEVNSLINEHYEILKERFEWQTMSLGSATIVQGKITIKY